VLRAQDRFSEALPKYRAGVDIAKKLAQRDPGNDELARDLAVAYAKLARWHRQAGNMSHALTFFREGHAIMERIARLSPEHVGWRDDLAWFDAQIAKLRE